MIETVTHWKGRTYEATAASHRARPRTSKHIDLQAVSTGHGWFRTSDLSRVKRYVSPRENARSACKSAGHAARRPETEFYGVCVCFTGVRAAGASQLPIQTERRVSVKPHPVSSLELSCLAALSPQGAPDGPTYSGSTPSRSRSAHVRTRKQDVGGASRDCCPPSTARVIVPVRDTPAFGEFRVSWNRAGREPRFRAGSRIAGRDHDVQVRSSRRVPSKTCLRLLGC